MRRPAALAATPLALAGLLLFAACSGSSSKGSATTTPSGGSGVTTTVNPNKPKVPKPASIPTTLQIKDLKTGTGPVAKSGDTIIVNYVGVRSADGTEFDDNWSREPFEVPLGAGSVIPGWDQGLVGVQKGTERRLDIPASLAYGDSPPDTSATAIVKAGDALSFVVDVIAVFPGSKSSEQPKVTVTAEPAQTTLSVKELQIGSGDTPVDGQHVAVRLILYRADTAALVTSTWGGPPLVMELGPNSNTYPGFVQAAKGMKVGGRRIVHIPYSMVFKGAGSTTLKIPAKTDIIAVVDLVGVY